VGLDYEDYVVVDEKFYRPAEVNVLKADPSRACEDLDWETEITFEELIREMTQVEQNRVERSDDFWIPREGGVSDETPSPAAGKE
jgi:GDPmannose 4,6-dehydratase